MAAKPSPQASERRRRGRPASVGIVRRSTINLDAEDVARIEAFHAHLMKTLPKAALSDSTILKQLLLKGLDAFEKEHRAQHELPLESSTTKS